MSLSKIQGNSDINSDSDHYSNESNGDYTYHCNCSSKINDHEKKIIDLQKTIAQLVEKLEEFEKRFENVDFSNLDGKTSTTNIIKMRPLIKEKLYDNADEKVDADYVQDKLENGTIKSDFLVIKRIYFRGLEKHQIPIRVYKKGYLEYWANDKWTIDKNGSKTLSILISNLKSYYIKVNKADLYIDNPNIFIKNQTHIHEMKGKKYRAEIYKMIVDYFEDI